MRSRISSMICARAASTAFSALSRFLMSWLTLRMARLLPWLSVNGCGLVGVVVHAINAAQQIVGDFIPIDFLKGRGEQVRKHGVHALGHVDLVLEAPREIVARIPASCLASVVRVLALVFLFGRLVPVAVGALIVGEPEGNGAREMILHFVYILAGKVIGLQDINLRSGPS